MVLFLRALASFFTIITLVGIFSLIRSEVIERRLVRLDKQIALLELKDEQGKVISVNGFHINQNAIKLARPFEPDANIVNFSPPEETKVSFSWALYNSSPNRQHRLFSCSMESVFGDSPSMENILNQAKESDFCGQVDLNLCMRLQIDEDPRNKNFFIKLPSIAMELPCQEESFASLGFEIAGGVSHTLEDYEEISLTNAQSIKAIYLTNTPNCEAGGKWQSIDETPLYWHLPWNGKSQSVSVYAKFRDIYDNESKCYKDSIKYAMPGGLSPHGKKIIERPIPEILTTENKILINNGDPITDQKAAKIQISSVVANQVYLTKDSSCKTGGVWQEFMPELDWELKANRLNTVYAKFRDFSLNESICVSDSIVHRAKRSVY